MVQINLQNQVQGFYVNTKAAIEALSGVQEGALAYATDTNEFGTYNGTLWTWGQGGAGIPLSPTFYDDITNGQLIRWDDDDEYFTPFSLPSYGDVNGPGGSTVGNIPTFNLSTGKSIGDSGVSIDSLLNQWIPVSEAWTRTGNHVFTVPGDLTLQYRKGAKIRYKDGGSNEYGVVGSSSHAGGTTTVNLIPNIDYTMAAATITDRYISYGENPESFPQWFNFTTTPTRSSVNYTNLPTINAAKWKAKPREITVFITATMHATPGGSGYQNYTSPLSVSGGVGSGINSVGYGLVVNFTGTNILVFKYDGSLDAVGSTVYAFNGACEF